MRCRTAPATRVAALLQRRAHWPRVHPWLRTAACARARSHAMLGSSMRQRTLRVPVALAARDQAGCALVRHGLADLYTSSACRRSIQQLRLHAGWAALGSSSARLPDGHCNRYRVLRGHPDGRVPSAQSCQKPCAGAQETSPVLEEEANMSVQQTCRQNWSCRFPEQIVGPPSRTVLQQAPLPCPPASSAQPAPCASPTLRRPRQSGAEPVPGTAERASLGRTLPKLHVARLLIRALQHTGL